MRKMDPRRDVTVKLENLPDEIYVGVPILATVTVENQSSHNLQLQIQFRKDSTNGIYCSSLSHQVSDTEQKACNFFILIWFCYFALLESWACCSQIITIRGS